MDDHSPNRTTPVRITVPAAYPGTMGGPIDTALRNAAAYESLKVEMDAVRGELTRTREELAYSIRYKFDNENLRSELTKLKQELERKQQEEHQKRMSELPKLASAGGSRSESQLLLPRDEEEIHNLQKQVLELQQKNGELSSQVYVEQRKAKDLELRLVGRDSDVTKLELDVRGLHEGTTSRVSEYKTMIEALEKDRDDWKAKATVISADYIKAIDEISNRKTLDQQDAGKKVTDTPLVDTRALEAKLESLMSENSKLLAEIHKEKSEKEEWKEKSTALSTQLVTLSNDSTDRLQQQQHMHESVVAERDSLRSAVDQLRTDIIRLESEKTGSATTPGIVGATTDSQHLQTIATLTNERDTLRKDIDALRSQIVHLQSSQHTTTTSQEPSDLTKERNELQKKLSEVQGQRDQLNVTLTELKAELEQSKRNVAAMASVSPHRPGTSSPMRSADGVPTSPTTTAPSAQRLGSRRSGGDMEISEFLQTLMHHLEAARTSLDPLRKFCKGKSPDEILRTVPGVGKISNNIEKLLEDVDSIIPPQCIGAGGSRFEFSVDHMSDPGQPDYFRTVPDRKVTIEEAVKIPLDFFSDFVVCKLCDRGVRKVNVQKHNVSEHAGERLERPEPMTHEWVIRECTKWQERQDAAARARELAAAGDGIILKSGDGGSPANASSSSNTSRKELWPVRVYTLESPLCYRGNAAMRFVTGDGRNPFETTRDSDKDFVNHMWKFEFLLMRALRTLPNVRDTAYRAVEFNVSTHLYYPGSIVTWNQPSSASLDPRVVKGFLGSKGGAVKGTIFIIHVSSAKNISSYSQYPEEKEVLLLPNTQLRVLPPVGRGVKQLLSYALRCSLDQVAVVEMQEVHVHTYSDIYKADSVVLLNDEKERLQNVLLKLRDCDREKKSVRTQREVIVRDPVTCVSNARDSTLLSDMTEELLRQVLTSCPSAGTFGVFLHRITTFEQVAQSLLEEALDHAVCEVTKVDVRCSVYAADTIDHTAGQYMLPESAEIVTLLFDKVGKERTWELMSKFAAPKMKSTDAKKGDDKKDQSKKDEPPEPSKEEPREEDTNNEDTDDYKKDLSRQRSLLFCLAGAGRSKDVDWWVNKKKSTYGSQDLDKLIGEALFYCSMSGAVEAVPTLLQYYTSNSVSVDVNGVTPIHVAAYLGNVEVLRKIVEGEFHFWVSSTMLGRVTALHIAAHAGRLHVVTALSALWKPLIRDADEGGKTPLWIACYGGHLEIVRHLVSEDRSALLCVDTRGRSPLASACKCGHLDIVKFLLYKKIDLLLDPTYWTHRGLTPLHIASRYGHLDIVAHMVEECPELISISYGKDGVTCLDEALEGNHVDVVEYLGKRQESLLEKHCTFRAIEKLVSNVSAAKHSRLELIKILSKRNPSILQGVNEQGQTLLHIGVSSNDLNLIQYLYKSCGEGTIRKRDNCGMSCLDASIMHMCDDTTKYLCGIPGVADDHALLSALRSGSVTNVEIVMSNCPSLFANIEKYLTIAWQANNWSILEWYLAQRTHDTNTFFVKDTERIQSLAKNGKTDILASMFNTIDLPEKACLDMLEEYLRSSPALPEAIAYHLLSLLTSEHIQIMCESGTNLDMLAYLVEEVEFSELPSVKRRDLCLRFHPLIEDLDRTYCDVCSNNAETKNMRCITCNFDICFSCQRKRAALPSTEYLAAAFIFKRESVYKFIEENDYIDWGDNEVAIRTALQYESTSWAKFMGKRVPDLLQAYPEAAMMMAKNEIDHGDRRFVFDADGVKYLLELGYKKLGRIIPASTYYELDDDDSGKDEWKKAILELNLSGRDLCNLMARGVKDKEFDKITSLLNLSKLSDGATPYGMRCDKGHDLSRTARSYRCDLCGIRTIERYYCAPCNRDVCRFCVELVTRATDDDLVFQCVYGKQEEMLQDLLNKYVDKLPRKVTSVAVEMAFQMNNEDNRHALTPHIPMNELCLVPLETALSSNDDTMFTKILRSLTPTSNLKDRYGRTYSEVFYSYCREGIRTLFDEDSTLAPPPTTPEIIFRLVQRGMSEAFIEWAQSRCTAAAAGMATIRMMCPSFHQYVKPSTAELEAAEMKCDLCCRCNPEQHVCERCNYAVCSECALLLQNVNVKSHFIAALMNKDVSEDSLRRYYETALAPEDQEKAFLLCMRRGQKDGVVLLQSLAPKVVFSNNIVQTITLFLEGSSEANDATNIILPHLHKVSSTDIDVLTGYNLLDVLIRYGQNTLLSETAATVPIDRYVRPTTLPVLLLYGEVEVVQRLLPLVVAHPQCFGNRQDKEPILPLCGYVSHKHDISESTMSCDGCSESKSNYVCQPCGKTKTFCSRCYELSSYLHYAIRSKHPEEIVQLVLQQPELKQREKHSSSGLYTLRHFSSPDVAMKIAKQIVGHGWELFRTSEDVSCVVSSGNGALINVIPTPMLIQNADGVVSALSQGKERDSDSVFSSRIANIVHFLAQNPEVGLAVSNATTPITGNTLLHLIAQAELRILFVYVDSLFPHLRTKLNSFGLCPAECGKEGGLISEMASMSVIGLAKLKCPSGHTMHISVEDNSCSACESSADCYGARCTECNWTIYECCFVRMQRVGQRVVMLTDDEEDVRVGVVTMARSDDTVDVLWDVDSSFLTLNQQQQPPTTSSSENVVAATVDGKGALTQPTNVAWVGANSSMDEVRLLYHSALADYVCPRW